MGHARQVCWTTYRDELPDLADHLPNVTRIEMLSRESPAPGVVKLVNRWHADGEVPAVAQRFISKEMVHWTERVSWDDNTWVCTWEIEPAFFTEFVTVRGATEYVDVGDGRCEIHIQGELKVDVSGMRGVPRLLAGRVSKAIEGFIGALILPNMQRLNRSVDRVLDQRGAATKA